MELHRKLTIFGIILLAATFFINSNYEQNNLGTEFNFAYLTGVAMLISFLISFILFNKEKLKS